MPLLTEPLCFLDIETTGLDPAACSILEIGFVLVDPDMELIFGTSWVVGGLDVEALHWDPVARAMHEENRLIADLGDVNSEMTLGEIDFAIQKAIRNVGLARIKPAGPAHARASIDTARSPTLRRLDAADGPQARQGVRRN